VNTLSYKTVSAKAEDVKKEWVVVDATDQVLGRLCAKVAIILRGKHKPCYTPHVDCGDNVIIINAEKVKLTGNKMTERQYVSYTGYPGGQRFATPEILMKKSYNKHLKPGMHPLYLHVIKGMLPKNRLGAQLLKNVHIYNGSNHPHEAQQPKTIDINTIK
jgi:large subunit ribosomal protein L13